MTLLVFTTRRGREVVEHDPQPVPDGSLPYVCRKAVAIGRFAHSLRPDESIISIKEIEPGQATETT